jgi:hypothetical protein
VLSSRCVGIVPFAMLRVTLLFFPNCLFGARVDRA